MSDFDLIVFDVNETLLDVSALRPAFVEAVGETVALPEWFARLVHGSLVANHLGRYRPFGEIGIEALMWLAEREGVPLDRNAAERVVAGMRSLPAHTDVVPALGRLAASRFQLVAYTNGSTEAAKEQLESAGLSQFFDKVMSVDGVGRFKPSPEVYLHCAAVCRVEIDHMLMVAAHDWDVAGAMSVGAGGAFVERLPWGFPGPAPTFSVPDLGALADALGAPPPPI